MNLLYFFTVMLYVGAGIAFLAIMLFVIVHMIRNWDKPSVQELNAPVREYLLTDPTQNSEQAV
ncbi:MAG: hypothetical protein SPG61_07475 [Arcanobacterium sp.]|nr:hypothetical protein [Arcanobacterium sp.]